MLADTLKDQFNDLADRSSHYWQELAEHTALRIREFGRLQGYKKAKARYYKLVVILDDRTSDICRALAAQDKVYPLNDAIEVMDNLMALDTKSNKSHPLLPDCYSFSTNNRHSGSDRSDYWNH